MKTIRFSIILIFVVLLVGGCQTLTTVTQVEEGPPPFTPIDPDTLDASAQLAVMSIDLARMSTLDGFPYVRIGTESRIVVEDQTDLNRFWRDQWVIVEDETRADGFRSLVVLDRFVDETGRVALCTGSVLYTEVSPEDREKMAIRKSLAAGYKTTKALEDQELRRLFDERVRDFQKSSGLAADGIVGKKTLAVMLEELRIIEIAEIAIETVYPREHTPEMYILSKDAVDRDPYRYTDGFKSLEAVKERAIDPDAFKAMANKEREAVIFVFFHHRVDPASAIQIGFSKFQQSRSQEKSPGLYNTPGNWPVLIWPIDIDKIDPFGSLYLNVYIDNRAIQGYKLH